MNLGDVCSYTFYLLLHFVTLSHVITLNDDYFRMFSVSYHIFYFCFGISSYYFLITTKNNPGEVDKNINPNTLNDNSVVEGNSNQNANSTNHSHNDGEEASINIDQKEKIQKSMIETFNVPLCEKCNIIPPFRSHHCSRCKKCIRKYDHHCGMIGGCIGEDNHLNFLIFLFTQSGSIGFNLVSLISTIMSILEKTKDDYTAIPISVFVLIFIDIFFGVFCVILFCFHIFLILTGQITFEIYHKEKCDYLFEFKAIRSKVLKDKGITVKETLAFHPFDMGLKRNILSLRTKTNWEEVFLENINKDYVEFNFCDNEYWSFF